MSSSGSDSRGRQRNANRTGFATVARSSRTRPTSALLSPHAVSALAASKLLHIPVSEELKAAIQNADLKHPAKAGGKHPCHSLRPPLSRQYPGRRKPALSYDIASNIIMQRGIAIHQKSFRLNCYSAFSSSDKLCQPIPSSTCLKLMSS